jgi:hypothetical protein
VGRGVETKQSGSFKVLPQYFLGQTDENKDKFQSESDVQSGIRKEQFQNKIISVTACSYLLHGKGVVADLR